MRKFYSSDEDFEEEDINRYRKYQDKKKKNQRKEARRQKERENYFLNYEEVDDE